MGKKFEVYMRCISSVNIYCWAVVLSHHGGSLSLPLCVDQNYTLSNSDISFGGYE